MNTASTTDEDLSLGDVGHLLVGLDGLDEFHLELAGIELGSELSHHTLATGLALHLLHHTGTHGRHLRTVVGADDGSHQVAAECGTRHTEFGLIVLIGLNLEFGAVGSQTRLETRSDAGSQVAADGGGTIEHDVGLALGDNLTYSLRVLLAEEVLQLGSVNNYDLVGTVLNEHLCLILDTFAEEHGNHLLAESIGQVTGLT